MGQTIDPKAFLLQQRGNELSAMVIKSSDLIKITELGIDVPLQLALAEQDFRMFLKQTVSEYNAHAALNSKSPEDFDDLYTRYSEYIEALKSFLERGSCTNESSEN